MCWISALRTASRSIALTIFRTSYARCEMSSETPIAIAAAPTTRLNSRPNRGSTHSTILIISARHASGSAAGLGYPFAAGTCCVTSDTAISPATAIAEKYSRPRPAPKRK